MKIVLAYALAMGKRATRLSKRMQAFTIASGLIIAIAYILSFEQNNPQWKPVFWILLVVTIALICIISFGWSFRTAFDADQAVLDLTGDVSGVQEFIRAGGYNRMASTGEPLKQNEKWVQKRLAALQRN